MLFSDLRTNLGRKIAFVSVILRFRAWQLHGGYMGVTWGLLGGYLGWVR